MTGSDSELIRVRPALIDAHRASRAASADIQRAYLRFTWARRKAPAKLSVLRWLSAGVAIGLGVASAATLLPPPGKRSAPPSDRPEVVAAPSKRSALRTTARSGAVQEEPARSEPLPAASEPPPAPLPARSSNGTLTGAAQRAAALPSAASAASASDWQRAATALRGGDLTTAEAALANLEQSDSVRDRQAAELARAQLLVRRGRAAEAIPTLQRLAREGSSPVIRSQAASMLQSLGE